MLSIQYDYTRISPPSKRTNDRTLSIHDKEMNGDGGGRRRDPDGRPDWAVMIYTTAQSESLG